METVLSVAGQEFRARARTWRWRALFAAWTLVVGLLTVALYELFEGGILNPDRAAFGGLMVLVPPLIMLVTPALSARAAGRPAGSVLGGFLADWGVGALLLALALPFVAYPAFAGGADPVRVLVALAVALLLLGVVCALVTYCAAVAGRAVWTVVVSSLTVFGLVFGTWIAYAVSLLALPDDLYGPRAWWLLAPNPVVVLADAVPREDNLMLCEPSGPGLAFERCHQREPDLDLLTVLSFAVRDVKSVPVAYDEYNEAAALDEGTPGGEGLTAVWPYGLAFDLVLAAGALTLTARRRRRAA
ncbi:hypothetical protein GCM10022221_11190 [Actinocorallia aurea]